MRTVDVEITIKRKERLNWREGGRAEKADAAPQIPRITRLMALAIEFQDMVDRGAVRDYADLARLGYVSRARITQIMNLLNLAPDIQETILHLHRDCTSPASITERDLRRVSRIINWEDQRRKFVSKGIA